MTDQEFEDKWAKGKEHDRLEREQWLAMSKEQRDQIKRQQSGFRSWEDLTDDSEAKSQTGETPTDR